VNPDDLAASVLLVLTGLVTAWEFGKRALAWLARRVIGAGFWWHFRSYP
jgi:hypothetical protein